ncbi:MAG: ATP-binding cassette domain-containing protein [Lachnospiraceae bacterium]|nr:ATP-binding cassette domain-containing protein [Lachnospiraceae bacterium]
MEEKKVLLSVRDLNVKFHVRGRTLSAIRGISLDIYENESIAIVGESGSGKTVFTKTFAGMLDSNGYIDQGDIIFNDPELSDTRTPYDDRAKRSIAGIESKLNEYSRQELGAATYQKMKALEKEKKERLTLSEADEAAYEEERGELLFQRAETFNKSQTFDKSKEKDKIKEAKKQLADLDAQIQVLDDKRKKLIKEHEAANKKDTAYNQEYDRQMSALKVAYSKECKGEISEETRKRNGVLAKEVYLSVGRYTGYRKQKISNNLMKAIREAMKEGVDLSDEEARSKVFGKVTFRVQYLDEQNGVLHGHCILNLAHISEQQDWDRIRGSRIAFIFQDPMTSLNPVLTIGKQITSVIMKHQHLDEKEARVKALEMMQKVGIPNAENRFDDYPFQYSGGMRQRIVIAIALSCQPKILICDEPTTALDVTIQAQILKLIKDLQKEFGYTIVFITHDLGVVANIAQRVAVLYGGQMIELGTAREVFYDPRHPYTWALLSSLPQLADKNTKLYSINGTPPSLYNRIVGDAFAPRNPYCLKVDTLKEPPMFQVTDTHYAKTWLLDPRSRKVEKPEIINDIHGTLIRVFNIV